jgi:hypothetical protein
MALVACLGILACDSDDDAGAVTEGAETTTGEAENPCAFALTVEGENPDAMPIWTSATLGEDSSALCPPANDEFLTELNNTEEEEEDEEEDEEDDCEPVQDTTVDTCTFTLSCDSVTGEFTATEDGKVTATFVITVESEEGEDDVICDYELVGEVELP